jgi:short-subunit dehydrogenase
MSDPRPFAIITGASTGIGFKLAKRCVKQGYDLLIAADEPEIEKAAASLRDGGTKIEALQADPAFTERVDCLYAVIKGRQVDALLANAGRGLGYRFTESARM